MDDAFGRILDALDDEEEIIQEMLQIDVPDIVIEPIHEMIEIFEYDKNHNMLNHVVREAFRVETVFEETYLFTAPISTTNTVEGYMSNVAFHERELIMELEPDSDIVMYRCNYDRLRYVGYIEPVKIRTTKRGRKKQVKKKKARKKQGNGDDFNSQVTFVVRSRRVAALEDGTIPYGAKVFKFKIFRTGKIQLPGVCPNSIDDVVECSQVIADTLNMHLHPGEQNPARMTQVINMNPVMKNYKFAVKIPPGSIIDLGALAKTIAREAAVPHAAEPVHPPVFFIKYTREDTKLSVKFSTPIPRRPKKKTRVNIFMRGKINILGGFEAEVTRQICTYLHWLFEENYENIIAEEGRPDTAKWFTNIMPLTENECAAILYDCCNFIPDVFVSQEDLDRIGELAEEYHREKIEAADAAIDEMLGGSFW